MADKFKNARQRMKALSSHKKNQFKKKLTRASNAGGTAAVRADKSSTSGNRKELGITSAPSDNNSLSVER